MSLQLINLSQDLKRLKDEGYDIEIKDNHLVVNHIPYVNSNREVEYGSLISVLSLSGDVTIKPETHVVYFSGKHPCLKDGTEISQIKHQSKQKKLSSSLIADHSFSSKPPEGYVDYFQKMETYANIISGPACSIDPQATTKPFRTIVSSEDHSIFKYIDTASSRAGINLISQKLESESVGIIGLGGTGAYVLDLVVKTPVKEIVILDGDVFSQHNAFRAPGAPSIEVLRSRPFKVDYLKEVYSNMHNNIKSYAVYVDETNLDLLSNLNFVFICMDKSDSKRLIVEKLIALSIPFIDVGIGVNQVEDKLIGLLRVTLSTPEKSDHIYSKNRIPFHEANENNEYSRNIQIADLNSLNAALAVIKWKKFLGFYVDIGGEQNAIYSIDTNSLINEDAHEARSKVDS